MIAKFQDWYLKFCFDTLFAKARLFFHVNQQMSMKAKYIL